jgi:hypothetical protein
VDPALRPIWLPQPNEAALEGQAASGACAHHRQTSTIDLRDPRDASDRSVSARGCPLAYGKEWIDSHLDQLARLETRCGDGRAGFGDTVSVASVSRADEVTSQ